MTSRRNEARPADLRGQVPAEQSSQKLVGDLGLRPIRMAVADAGLRERARGAAHLEGHRDALCSGHAAKDLQLDLPRSLSSVRGASHNHDCTLEAWGSRSLWDA